MLDSLALLMYSVSKAKTLGVSFVLRKGERNYMNVAAYCRVSTDEEDQKNSFESQKLYFENYINNNPEWNLVNIYADEGITGTNTKKRVQFQKMINDASKGIIDLILTKEVSRFARNTVDTLSYLSLIHI